MKKQLLTTTSILSFLLIIVSGFTTLTLNTNFSGKWKLNEGKSELGQFANFATRMIEAEQNESSITISRTAPSFDGGDRTDKEVLTFDGKESENKVFGESKKVSVASWSEDGKMLKSTYKLYLSFNGETTEISGVETWALSDDGKTLTAENKSSSSFGDMVTKSVYEKQ